MEDKEAVYDAEIFPLMKQIMAICKINQIPMFTTFQYAEDSFCTSMQYKGTDHRLFHSLDALYQSREGQNINIDKFMFWVMREAKQQGHCSLILKQLGVEESAIKEQEK